MHFICFNSGEWNISLSWKSKKRAIGKFIQAKHIIMSFSWERSNLRIWVYSWVSLFWLDSVMLPLLALPAQYSQQPKSQKSSCCPMFYKGLYYSGVHIRIDKPCFMKQMAYFWPSLIGNKNAITPLPFRVHFSIDYSFKMRYCMTFYLNWRRSYVRLKLKACFLLSEFGSSNFDLS